MVSNRRTYTFLNNRKITVKKTFRVVYNQPNAIGVGCNRSQAKQKHCARFKNRLCDSRKKLPKYGLLCRTSGVFVFIFLFLFSQNTAVQIPLAHSGLHYAYTVRADIVAYRAEYKHTRHYGVGALGQHLGNHFNAAQAYVAHNSA